MSTFIALGIPKSAAEVLTTALDAYKGKLAATVPETKWHMTLVFLGSAELSLNVLQKLQEPLRTAYLPAITILSLGVGKKEGQLWAHVHATPAVTQVRQLFIDRLAQCNIPILEQETTRDFSPHISLGTLANNSSSISALDIPAKITFAVKQALVLRSIPEEPETPYERIATIPLVP